MNTSLNWLQDHIDLSDYSTDALSDLLTFAGIEVEGIQARGAGVDHVVVGQVKSSEPHPGADRLSVCQVDDGSGSLRQIVCGAKNYKVDDKVPVALPGAVLPGDFKIKEGKLRGVVSNGMMCSGRELQLSDDHEGLLILKTDAATGTPIGELFESDTLLELEITPNRPDCLSHLGIARELAALAKRPLKGVAHHGESSVTQQPAKADEITLEATEACPFYTARRITGVKVGPSPDWMKSKLEAIGLRPINNIVDITNYVLFEMGQPLHAFDVAKLDGGIRVRLASEGEKFLALDGNEYALETDDLVIADQSKAVAIGGVMGGEDSGVTEGTTDVLLESAYFTPSHIRRTSRRLDLSSDSSYRFDRGIDPAQTVGASELATKLILEIAGGEAEDVLLVAGEVPAPPAPVTLDHGRAQRLLGTDLSEAEMGEILTGLGLESQAQGAWNVPTFRGDLERHVDLVEEIARVYGIDKIPAREVAFFAEPSKEDARYDAYHQLRQRLVAFGYDDCLTIKLISDAQLADDLCSLRLGKQNQAVPLKKPLSQDHTTLRPSVVPGLLDVAERNIRHGAKSLKFFEIGTVFSKHEKSPNVLESQQLGILLSGDTTNPSWHGDAPEADIYDLIGLCEALFGGGKQAVSMRRLEQESLLVAAEILLGKSVIGRLGQVHPARAREMDCEGPLYVAEIDLAKAIKPSLAAEPVAGLPKFPAITRDIALEVPLDMENAEVANFLSKQNDVLLVGFEMFDLFADPSGEKLPADRKSLAYTLTYRSSDRTLKSEEVDKAHAKVLAALPKLGDVKQR